MLREQLAWAVSHGMIERIRLLAAHGVNMVEPFQGKLALAGSRTPVELALMSGLPHIAELLRDLGAPRVEMHPQIRLAAALLSGDADQVHALISRSADLLDGVRSERPALVLRAAVAGSAAGVELLLRNGFDVNAYGRQDVPMEQEWETALHYGAGAGDVGLAGVLLDAGADPNLLDTVFMRRRWDGRSISVRMN